MSQASETSKTVDVLVVGGGVNGTGIALDAVGRGLSVMLCEKGDLAGATSSSSSKLIHGGLRYLEHYEFRLVKEALAEREVLLKKAPHIMWPLRFRLPHQKHLRPSWMIRIGLFLYDSLAKRNILPRSTRVANTPASPLVADIDHCFEYSDGWVDDSRLVVLNAIAARELGAGICTRTECTHVVKAGQHWRVTLQSARHGTQTVYAKALVNAAGPWALSLLNRVENSQAQKNMRMVKGSHIIAPKLYESTEAYILQNKDGRIVFVIPYEQDFSLIGTTDEDFTGDPQYAVISQHEIDYLLDIVNLYFKRKLNQQDIVHSYSGVRPLVEEDNTSAQALTRDYKLDLHGHGKEPLLLNIFGGKITTYRKLAEQAVSKLAGEMQVAKGSWTKDVAMPGADFEDKSYFINAMREEFPWLPVKLIERYSRQYGTLCKRFLSNKASLEDLGQDFGFGLYRAEVDYLIDYEWAVTIDDILWRRTKHGLRLNDQQKHVLDAYVQRRSGNNGSQTELSA